MHTLPLGFFIALAALLMLQLFWYAGMFLRLALFRTRSGDLVPEGVSVVICAHNEASRLYDNLPAILEQNYPEFEVLVVDHHSDDDTPFVLQELSARYQNLKSITIKRDLNFFTGKKFPLSIGIKSARYPSVLLTDADCHPASTDWILRMQEGYRGGKEIVLGYSPYARRKGVLNRLIRFDTAHIAMQYLSYALCGIPYMGVGRNLSYRKDLFFRNKGFIDHYRIQSGDDDLFVNRVANGNNTAVVADPEAFTISEPKENPVKWFTQKRRHLSTGKHYRFHHRLMLGVYAVNPLLFYSLATAMILMRWSVLPVTGLIVIRLAAQYAVFDRCLHKLRERDLVLFAPLMELILLILNIYILISNLFFRQVRWK